ncbi:MAG: MFS transporter [Proteobacteria bacterium]|nr:MFS transporter [Pseudomonadota bacterium]
MSVAALHIRDYPSGRYAWYVLVVFFIAAILSYTDRLVLNLLVDPIRRDIHISDTQVSLLQGAAFAVVYSIISLPLGRFADTHNRRNVLIAGVLIWSVATALCGFAGSFGEMFVARIGVGVGEACLAPAIMSMIPDYFPENRRGTAYGVFLTGMAMGGGAAIMIGGTLFDGFESGRLGGLPGVGHMVPWRAVLVALSVPGFLMAGLMMTVREPVRQGKLSANAGAPSSFAETMGYFRKNSRTFGYLFAAFALENLPAFGIPAWIPSIFTRQFGMTLQAVGTVLGTVSLIGSGIGSILGGVVSDWLVPKGGTDVGLRLVVWLSIATVPLLVFPILPDTRWILGVYLVYLILNSMAATAGVTAMQNAVPSDMRGLSVAMQAFLYMIVGLGLGPTSMALVTDYVFHDSKAVGMAIFVVATPVTVATIVLIWLSLGHYRRTRAAMDL